MRLFFAVEIPADVRVRIYDSLALVRKQSPQIRWIPPDNLHITLKFLGEVPEKGVSEVIKCAENCIAKMKPGAFEISFARLGAFPNAKHPRVIWCGVDGNHETLSSIAVVLESELEMLGFEKEKRPYRAHLTVGKISPVKREVDFDRYIHDYEKTVFAGISVNMISLMQSVLNQHGAVHSLAGRPFGAVYQCIHQIYL